MWRPRRSPRPDRPSPGWSAGRSSGWLSPPPVGWRDPYGGFVSQSLYPGTNKGVCLFHLVFCGFTQLYLDWIQTAERCLLLYVCVACLYLWRVNKNTRMTTLCTDLKITASHSRLPTAFYTDWYHYSFASCPWWLSPLICSFGSVQRHSNDTSQQQKHEITIRLFLMPFVLICTCTHASETIWEVNVILM